MRKEEKARKKLKTKRKKENACRKWENKEKKKILNKSVK